MKKEKKGKREEKKRDKSQGYFEIIQKKEERRVKEISCT